VLENELKNRHSLTIFRKNLALIIECRKQPKELDGARLIRSLYNKIQKRRNSMKKWLSTTVLTLSCWMGQPLISAHADSVSTNASYDDTSIFGNSVYTADQLLAFSQNVNPDFPKDLPSLYLQIGAKYGVRGDVAFCQMILETGYMRFDGDVTANQKNFAGIGATGYHVKGHQFQTVEEGVEAQIQHLYAYATDTPLPDTVKIVDPRFRYVPRGTAPDWEKLDGHWAVPGVGYGEKIFQIWQHIAG
jgi:hypothetical protein